MSEKYISCAVCGEVAGRIDGEKLIAYSHSANHSVEFSLEDIAEAKAQSDIQQIADNFRQARAVLDSVMGESEPTSRLRIFDRSPRIPFSGRRKCI